MSHEPVDRRSPVLLYALRLRPASPLEELQGEVEHVVSGDRRQFRGAWDLVTWLQSHNGAARPAPTQADADEGPGAGPRDATT